MKNSRGKRPSRIGVDEGNGLLYAAIVAVVVVFIVAYYFGSSDVSGSQVLLAVKRRDAAKAVAAQCREEMADARTQIKDLGSPEVDKLDEEIRELEAQNRDADDRQDEWSNKRMECLEKTRLLKNSWKIEDAANEKKLEALDLKNKDLIRKTKQLHGTRGMRTLLLISNLKRLTDEMQALRDQLEFEKVKVTNDFLEELVQEWKEQSMGTSNMQVDEFIRPVMPEEIIEREIALYDPDKDAKSVFFPKKTPDGQWMVPTWNQRKGTQDLRHGTFIGSTYLPVTNINKQMRTLYDYAICAVALNITGFMYPSLFKTCPDCTTEYLHNLIETPIVLFCDDCGPHHTTDEFKLLCRGYLDENQYGSALFWRARSRLRFKANFMRMAEDWMLENGLTQREDQPQGGESSESNSGSGTSASSPGPWEMLALRIPRDEAYRVMCGSNKTRVTLLYDRILKRRAVEIGRDHEQSCYPDWSYIIENVNAFLAHHPNMKVYLSMDPSPTLDDDVANLQSKINSQVFFRQPTGKKTEDNIVDTFICSQATHLFVSRFEAKSTLIAEAYMLQNKLRVRNISVW